jgi:small subunit ribosomal protein S2
MNITVRDLLDAGVHFGHQIRRWNPRSKPFIHDHRHGISIIDLEKTYQQLEISCQFLEELVAKGKDVLFVATKKQAKDIIREASTNVNMPFSVNRWMGGTLTNFVTIKSSLAKYHKFLAMEADGRLAKLPGKESAAIRRQMERMYRNFEGLKEVKDLPGAMFVVDIKSEAIAIAEARILGIPVVAIVDTNSDPSLVDYPIPANDDAAKSIRIIVETITEAVQNGLANREIKVQQKGGFTPTPRNENYESDHETGVTLPEGYEEFADEVSAPAVAETAAEEVEAEVEAPAPVVEEPAPEVVEAPVVEEVVETPAATETAEEKAAEEKPVDKPKPAPKKKAPAKAKKAAPKKTAEKAEVKEEEDKK